MQKEKQNEKWDYNVRNDIKPDDEIVMEHAIYRYFKDKLDKMDKSAVKLTTDIQTSPEYNYNPSNRRMRNGLEGRVDFTWGEIGILLRETGADPKEFVDYIIAYALELGKLGKINNGKEYDTTAE